MLFKRITFWLALAGIVGMVFMVLRLRQKPPPPPPVTEPSRSPFTNFVAATGIIEAARENVKIATTKAGLVARVLVKVGDHVPSGAPLFQLDDREARTAVSTALAQVESLRAALEAERVMTRDARDQYERAQRLLTAQAISEDEKVRKQFLLENWEARCLKLAADVTAATAQLAAARTNLEVLTVRAPRDGELLQVNVREGEYANVNPTEPLMILGDVETLQIRADVDEQNAPLVRANQAAVALPKGNNQMRLPLRFVRIEPFVVPKRSLTGDSAERVDTRVLQIIFQMDRPALPLYVGQQVDVFVEVPADVRAALLSPIVKTTNAAELR